MDKRKNNGGNSTKARRPDDKRLNPAKALLEKYINEEFSYDKANKLFNKLYQDGMNGDVKSATLFLSYVLGKPKETKEIQVELDKSFPDWLDES
jgi:hypothetical protein